jgi:hypothetical protein
MQDDCVATLSSWMEDPVANINPTACLMAGMIFTQEGNYVEALKACHGSNSSLEMCDHTFNLHSCRSLTWSHSTVGLFVVKISLSVGSSMLASAGTLPGRIHIFSAAAYMISLGRQSCALKRFLTMP